MELDFVMRAIDIAAAVVFTATGALVASRKEMDILGFLWLGLITGIGGGTLRDLLLGVPVFWVKDPMLIATCLGAAAVLHFAAPLVAYRYRLLLYLDALGMALVAVAGTAKGLEAGAGPLVALVMGVITASFGGILRDLLGQEPSIILRKEIYVTAAVAGAGIFLLLEGAGMAREGAMGLGIVAAAAIRCAAIRGNWAMPVYRARRGRVPDETGKTGAGRTAK